MLATGQTINGFTIRHIVAQTRGETRDGGLDGEPDGAIAFGVRVFLGTTTWVTARFFQYQIEGLDSPTEWSHGDYYEGEDKYPQALAAFLERAGLVVAPEDAPPTLRVPEPLHTPEGVTYHPWADDSAMGFRAVHDATGEVELIYLNPSTEDTNGHPNVFLYHDAIDPGDGAPYSGSECYLCVHEKHYPGDDGPEDLP